MKNLKTNTSRVKIYKSLGQLNYLSCLKYVDAILGNSSSGIMEAPSFKIGTINVGSRQLGRIKAESIIDCEPKKSLIIKSLKKLYSKNFQNKLKKVKNPYGNGGASDKVIDILNDIELKNIFRKKFYDL